MLLRDFLDFIREQGVVGLAVGFVVGGAIKDVISAFVNDILNPLLGIFLGRAENLKALKITIGAAEIKWGDFVAVVLDFLIMSFVVYYVIKISKLQRLDKQKA